MGVLLSRKEGVGKEPQNKSKDQVPYLGRLKDTILKVRSVRSDNERPYSHGCEVIMFQINAGEWDVHRSVDVQSGQVILLPTCAESDRLGPLRLMIIKLEGG